MCIVPTLALIRYVYADISMIATSTPAVLREDNLNGAVIHLALSGDSFMESISVNDIILNNGPGNAAVSNINLISTTQVDVTLSYDNTHIGSDITDFSITVDSNGIMGNVSTTSNNTTIYSVLITLTAKTNPYTLFGPCLDGSIINVSLSENTSFVDPIEVSDFALNNNPINLSISEVTRLSNNSARLVLAHNDNDLTQNISNFSVSVLPSGNLANEDITSTNILIKAAPDIEGNQTYISTGESYPTTIQLVGCNYRDKKVYVNFKLTTTKSVSSNQTASFQYFINVFNNSGTLIGSYGSIESPQVVSALQGINSIDVLNNDVQLDSITNSYSIVIIVVKVDIV